MTRRNHISTYHNGTLRLRLALYVLFLICCVCYGNGTHAAYTYDSLMRLATLGAWTSPSAVLQAVTYAYDPVGNVTAVANTAGQTANGLGGAYSGTYTYDSLYRLVQAVGYAGVPPAAGTTAASTPNYVLKAAYSPAGRMLRKEVTAASPATQLDYSRTYSYYDAQPHTVRTVDDGREPYALQWDANGNLLSCGGKDSRDWRRHCWTEENRLAAVADANFISHYTYDASGERVVKLSAETVNMEVNASGNRFGEIKEFTLYPSPYLVADRNGYTKHYYAGTERLCSRIGGGGLQNLHYIAAHDSAFRGKAAAYHLTFKTDLICAGAGATIRVNLLETLDRWRNETTAETKIYFYHPDHLGSASWITDASGQPIQHIQYLPYGETLIDQRTGSYSERYTFTGKEKDTETGYHYFGARYYNSDLSLWLSVDPMSDKYPSLSPYNYCVWNPMKLVDPDGNKPRLHFYGKRSKAAFERIVNSGLGGQFQSNLTRNSNGSYTFEIVATQGGGNYEKLNNRQQAFYSALESCIKAKAKDGNELNYDIDVHYGSSDIMVGKYQDNSIDVADMEQFNDLNKGGATKQGKLVHELVEQCKKAYFGNKKGDNMGWNNSHKKACLEEGMVNGNKRVVSGDKTLGRGVYQEKFIQNGKEHYVKIINTPIIGVEQ